MKNEILNLYAVVQALEQLDLTEAEAAVVRNAAQRQSGYVGTQFLTGRQQQELAIIYRKYFPDGN